MIKNYIILFFILLVLGIGFFFVKSKKVISVKEFEKMSDGKFKNISEILNLFPKNVEDIKRRLNLAIRMADEGLDEIISISPMERTFDNTIYAYDRVKARFSVVTDSLEVFEMISPNDDIRKVCHDACIKLNEFIVDAFFNKDLYSAFKEYLECEKYKEEKLTEEENNFLDESMYDFERLGFNLPDEEFKKIKELRKNIYTIGFEFDKNINTDNSYIEVTKAELKGLKDDFINNLEKSKDGKYILKCDYPTHFQVMNNCEVEKTRKNFYFKFANRAYPENNKLLDQIIEKRDEMAKKLGFKSYSHYDLDNQMVKTPTKARDFLMLLSKKTLQKSYKEFEELFKELPEGITLDKNGKLSAWDVSYVKDQYKKKHFNIDELEISKYFPVEHTILKMFDIYQKFLGLDFKFVSIDGLWHKDVKVVQVYDKGTNTLRGTLFLDLYPRDNKYSHACMAKIVSATKYKNNVVPAIIFVIANFPKPTKDRSALLKHSDVTTFFHEFGHAMHGVIGQTAMNSFSGTSVKRDFVEMPSQMFEEWMWDKDIIKMVSSHYKTGESLSDELIEKKIKLKKFNYGYFVIRQCMLSFLALDYFDEGKNKNTDKIAKDLYEYYIKHIRFEPETHSQASFGHLTGYGAKYYGYMWSKTFSLDLWSLIKKKGILDQNIGKKFSESILAKGGSVHPNILLKNFLGREPKIEAFLEEIGVS